MVGWLLVSPFGEVEKILVPTINLWLIHANQRLGSPKQ
jgi:hypothetical protein